MVYTSIVRRLPKRWRRCSPIYASFEHGGAPAAVRRGTSRSNNPNRGDGPAAPTPISIEVSRTGRPLVVLIDEGRLWRIIDRVSVTKTRGINHVRIRHYLGASRPHRHHCRSRQDA